MMGLIIGLHIIICFLLIIVILIQSGRGGGLLENLSGIESMLGPKTNAFLSRTTTALAVLFFITCLSLALLSARQSRSLMRGIKTPAVKPQEAPKIEETPAPQKDAVQSLEEKPAAEAPNPE